MPLCPVSPNGYESELQRTVQRVVVDRLMQLGSVAPMAQVRAISAYWLEDLAQRIDESTETDELGGIEGRAHVNALRRDIRRFLDHPEGIAKPRETPTAPPGSPIGDPGLRWLGKPHCSEPFVRAGW